MRPRLLRFAVKAAIAVTLSVILASGPTLAADKCHEATKLYGALMRASLICNFPERPALAKAIAVMRETCGPTPPSRLLGSAIENGFKIFERDRQRDGDRRACAHWDKLMSVLGKEQ